MHMRYLCYSAMVGLATMMSGQALAAVTYSFDRSTTHSSVQMTRSASSGESLATDTGGPLGPPSETSGGGDIRATFTWSDGTSLSGVWQNPSGKSLPSGAVLHPNTPVPGVHFDESQTAPFYRAFIEQSGDTFTNAWEIRNGSSAFGLAQVVLEAIGTPDMGFDTDDGNNPAHGDGGFALIVDGQSQYTGNVTVGYDWWNNWNGTTDMFHRMTINFTSTGGLLPTTSFVFFQDTDEVGVPVPEPMSLALFGLGLAGLGVVRRRAQRA